ncbi:MAG: sulfotransferase family 2 domain-containing protein [Planctomycetota bacterium]
MTDTNNAGSELTRYCWLHVHVPKAGGSTLRQLMNRNFGEGFYNSNSLLETKQYTREDVSEIVRCHPGVKCFCDHKLSLDLPFDHEHAKVYALCYVRDPVDRFVSRYFFHRHFEEVNCIAQRLSFRDFIDAELIQKEVHPQTNSQINFLNGGTGFEDMSIIRKAVDTNRAFLFPIERFDESCICLERLFPTMFSDLSYVHVNVSKRDAEISAEEKKLVQEHLNVDYPVVDLAHQFLDQLLAKTFHSKDDQNSALLEFQDRCSRRYDNFYPPVAPGEPLPSPGTIPSFAPHSEPTEPTEHDPRYPDQKLETKDSQEVKPTLPAG